MHIPPPSVIKSPDAEKALAGLKQSLSGGGTAFEPTSAIIDGAAAGNAVLGLVKVVGFRCGASPSCCPAKTRRHYRTRGSSIGEPLFVSVGTLICRSRSLGFCTSHIACRYLLIIYNHGMNSVAFFFGSGISYDSFKAARGDGAGTVGRITWRLLNESWQPVAGKYVPATPTTHPVILEEAQRLQELLREIKREADMRLWETEGRESHYEDIYEATWQLRQDLLLEITNPLIRRASEAIRRSTAHLWACEPASRYRDPFLSLLIRACTLVESVVVDELDRDIAPQGLDVISKLADEVPEIDIFTLNHDLLIERQLESTGHSYLDGFGEERPGYRIFSPNWQPKEEGRKIRILKLHGAVNAYRCHFKRMTQYAVFSRPPSDCKDDDNSTFTTDPLPNVLTGTIFKEHSYGTYLFGETFTQFRHLSSNHSKIVCCGYGWSDKGVNIRIGQWLDDRPERQLIILHANPIEELLGKRFWMSRWSRLTSVNPSKVIAAPQWLNKCSPAYIKDLLNSG